MTALWISLLELAAAFQKQKPQAGDPPQHFIPGQLR
jgi:hypothetical protein